MLNIIELNTRVDYVKFSFKRYMFSSYLPMVPWRKLGIITWNDLLFNFFSHVSCEMLILSVRGESSTCVSCLRDHSVFHMWRFRGQEFKGRMLCVSKKHGYQAADK